MPDVSGVIEHGNISAVKVENSRIRVHLASVVDEFIPGSEEQFIAEVADGDVVSGNIVDDGRKGFGICDESSSVRTYYIVILYVGSRSICQNKSETPHQYPSNLDYYLTRMLDKYHPNH